MRGKGDKKLPGKLTRSLTNDFSSIPSSAVTFASKHCICATLCVCSTRSYSIVNIRPGKVVVWMSICIDSLSAVSIQPSCCLLSRAHKLRSRQLVVVVVFFALVLLRMKKKAFFQSQGSNYSLFLRRLDIPWVMPKSRWTQSGRSLFLLPWLT